MCANFPQLHDYEVFYVAQERIFSGGLGATFSNLHYYYYYYYYY